MSKGDHYRPVNKQKYDKNYLRIYGMRCPICLGHGFSEIDMTGYFIQVACSNCHGVGYLEQKHSNTLCDNCDQLRDKDGKCACCGGSGMNYSTDEQCPNCGGRGYSETKHEDKS